MDRKDLGEHLTRLRAERGVGLRELCRDAGLSPASLSAIEKGQSSPTLATLHKIIKALGTDFAEFFAGTDEPDEPTAFRAKDMKVIEDAQRRYVLLFPKRKDFRFGMLHETIEASEKESEWETHDFDMGAVVLESGPVRLEIEGKGEWTLKKGDAFYVKAGLKHRATNLGKRPLKLITVQDPAKY